MVMLRVTSPSRSKVYALLADPPGEQPRAKNPNANAGSKSKAFIAPKEI